MNLKWVVGLGLFLFGLLVFIFLFDAVENPSALSAEETSNPSQATTRDRDNLPVPPAAPSDASSRIPLSAAPAQEFWVRGRVKDRLGNSVEGARVFVGAFKNPFPDRAHSVIRLAEENPLTWKNQGELNDLMNQSPAAMEKKQIVVGKYFQTDREGSFSHVLAGPEKVFARLVPSPGFRGSPSPQEGWFEGNREDIQFTVETLPRATFLLGVRNLKTKKLLREFSGYYRVQDDERRIPIHTEAALLSETIELDPQKLPRISVTLEKPEWAQIVQQFELLPGIENSLEIPLETAEQFEGTVLDPEGQPVAGALVFWGQKEKMRAGTIFKPFREYEIHDGVRSDSQGRFFLEGRGLWVSAWHPQYSPVTMSWEQASTLQLKPRGSIQGFCFRPDGRPAAGEPIQLNGETIGLTNASGQFSIEDLEAGTHSLNTPLGFFGVEVEPGEITLFQPSGFISEINLEFQSQGKVFSMEEEGLILGLSSTFQFFSANVRNGACRLWNLLPGDYLYMNEKGFYAPFRVEGPKALIEVESLDLTVHAAPGSQIYLVPDPLHDGVQHFAKGFLQEIPPSGRLKFSPLLSGRYGLGYAGKEVLRWVELRGPGEEIRLDP